MSAVTHLGGLVQLELFFSPFCLWSILVPPLPSDAALRLFFLSNHPEHTHCDLTPVLLSSVPGLFLLSPSSSSSFLCVRPDQHALQAAQGTSFRGELAFLCYSPGAAAENAPECISSSSLHFLFPLPHITPFSQASPLPLLLLPLLLLSFPSLPFGAAAL